MLLEGEIMKTIKRIEIRAVREKLGEPYDTRITSDSKAVWAVRQLMNGLDQERFLVLMMDVKNRIMGYAEVGRGGPDSCSVDMRALLRPAIVTGATSIIIVHNHPSNDAAPSDEDIALTARVKDCCKLIGIGLLDHLIVTDDSHCSLAVLGHC